MCYVHGSRNRYLTLRLLMSYIYMELLVKPELLTSYIYEPTFGNAETVSFYLLHIVSTLNQCREVSCVTFVCKHFASLLAKCLLQWLVTFKDFELPDDGFD